jgi:tetratricopeptide (TPR) repeat protein
MTTTEALCRVALCCAGLASMVLMTSHACAFQANVAVPAAVEEKAAQDSERIRVGERIGMDARNMGRLWGEMAMDYEEEGQFAKSEDAFNHALRLLEHAPSAAPDYATALDNLGSLYLAMRNDDAAERCRKRALALSAATDDGLETARSRAVLAEVYLDEQKYKEAQQMAEDAYNAMVALKDPRGNDFAAALITITFSSYYRGKYAYAVDRGREAVSRAEPGSVELGGAYMALGEAEWKAGMVEDADRDMRAGIEILRASTTPGRPYVLGAMALYAKYLKAMHRSAEAEEVTRRQRSITSQTPGRCNDCTVSVYGLQGH